MRLDDFRPCHFDHVRPFKTVIIDLFGFQGVMSTILDPGTFYSLSFLILDPILDLWKRSEIKFLGYLCSSWEDQWPQVNTHKQIIKTCGKALWKSGMQMRKVVGFRQGDIRRFLPDVSWHGYVGICRGLRSTKQTNSLFDRLSQNCTWNRILSSSKWTTIITSNIIQHISKRQGRVGKHIFQR